MKLEEARQIAARYREEAACSLWLQFLKDLCDHPVETLDEDALHWVTETYLAILNTADSLDDVAEECWRLANTRLLDHGSDDARAELFLRLHERVAARLQPVDGFGDEVEDWLAGGGE